MKLILSSCDFRNARSCQTIRDNLTKPIEQCRLLFIPNEKATAETIHSEKYYLRMKEFGLQRDYIHIFDYDNPLAFMNLQLDVIYISGGNTFQMLQKIRKSGFEKEIIRYVRSGVVYVGGSAGAHLATQNISHVSAFDTVPKDMTDFQGFRLFDGILICHYSSERKVLYEQLKSDGKYKVYALTDQDSIVVTI